MDSNIIVMISGSGTTLQSILDNCGTAKVVGVLSDQPNVEGITRAQKAKVPHIILIDRKPKETKEQHSDRMKKGIDIIIQMTGGVHYIVLAGFMRILTSDFIQHFRSQEIEIINIHPSLLPKHKGLHTYKKALEEGDESHGMTIHYVDEEVDGGDIIFQASFVITNTDNEKTLEKKTRELEKQYYPLIIDSLFCNEIMIP